MVIWDFLNILEDFDIKFSVYSQLIAYTMIFLVLMIKDILRLLSKITLLIFYQFQWISFSKPLKPFRGQFISSLQGTGRLIFFQTVLVTWYQYMVKFFKTLSRNQQTLKYVAFFPLTVDLFEKGYRPGKQRDSHQRLPPFATKWQK